MSDVIVGEWRNGLDPFAAQEVKRVEQLREKGFRLDPTDEAVGRLIDTLDGYDTFAQEVLTEEDTDLGDLNKVILFNPKPNPRRG